MLKSLNSRLIATFISQLTLLLFLTPCVAAEFTPRISGAAIRAHAEFLASDLLEGRATGSRGYELAAAYVAAQYRQYGLSPVEGDSYLQTVPLIEATVVLPGSIATLKREAVNDSFEFASDYLPAANFFNSPASVTAPLAFAGFGITAPELNYDDLAGVDLQGRIAVILEGAPKRFNAASRNYYAWRDTKYANLIRHGAVAVLEVMTGEYKTDSIKSDLAWERAVAMSWVTDMRRIDTDDQPAEPFPELKLRFRFKAEAAARLFSNGHSFEQVLLSAAAGEPQGFSLPGMMTLTATTGLRRITSNNVVGIVPGSDPELRREYVLVTANLDHLGRGAAINGDSIYNGLQHNATGVAMMLELAHALAAMPTKPKRSIIFAAVTAGEKSAQGIQHLLAASSINPASIVAAVSLNMPLPLARTSDVIAPGADQSSLGSNIVTATQQLNMRLSAADGEEGSLLNPELAPLVQAEIPTIAIRSGNRARASRVDMRALKRDYLQLHLDQPSDDSSASSLDIDAASDLDVLTSNLTALIANAAQRPMWYRSSLLHNKLHR